MTAPSPIADFDARYRLGIEAMDRVHREFASLVNRLADSDARAFMDLFPTLVAHTRAHFDAEQEMMAASDFPAGEEHRADHARVSGELERLLAKVARGRTQLARAYVCEQLPAWFDLHARTMDSALAAHLAKP